MPLPTPIPSELMGNERQLKDFVDNLLPAHCNGHKDIAVIFFQQPADSFFRRKIHGFCNFLQVFSVKSFKCLICNDYYLLRSQIMQIIFIGNVIFQTFNDFLPAVRIFQMSKQAFYAVCLKFRAYQLC